jgi:uncharacterized protein YhfF
MRAKGMATTHETNELVEYFVDKDARVRAFWAEFCKQAQLDVNTAYQAWHFGDSAELAHELVELVLHGPKRATTSLSWAIERRPDPAPVLHGYNLLCELDGTPRCVVRTVSIEVRAFKDVDAQYAWDEGEGDRTLDSWRADHWEYFTRECATLGREATEDMRVIMERFELLYP